MKKVFDDATKMIHFIKQGPVNSRMFKKKCVKTGQIAHKSPATYRNLVA
jgi:hypothetical protein